MNKSTPQNNTVREIIIGLIITILGGIIVAWVIREGELFQTNKDSVSQKTIVISLINHHCVSQDYYVDGEIVASAIAENETVIFKVAPGKHLTQSCAANTKDCTDSVVYDWTEPTTHSLLRASSCPIAITLTNYHCVSQDYYVDGKIVASAIAENETIIFKVTPGKHSTQSCTANTKDCTDSVVYDWTEPTTHSLLRASSCP